MCVRNQLSGTEAVAAYRSTHAWGASVLLVTVAVAASYIPARRAPAEPVEDAG